MTTVIEYGLIAGGVAVAFISAAFIIGDDIDRAMNGIETVNIIICDGPDNKLHRFEVGTYYITDDGTWGTFKDGRKFEYSPAVKCYLEQEIVEEKQLD